MRGLKIVVVVLMVLLLASCGLVGDRRGDGVSATESPDPTSVPRIDVSIPTTSALPPPSPESLEIPNEPEPSPPPDPAIDVTEADEPRAPNLPPEDLIALEHCARVIELQVAGHQVVEVAAEGLAIPRSALERVVLSLRDLEPIVPQGGQEALGVIRADFESVIWQLAQTPEVGVSEVQQLVQRLGPQFTQLLVSIDELCPGALGEGTHGQAESVELGRQLV